MVNETELVLVDTIHQFHVRYLIEVSRGKSEYALDTVACDGGFEFSQKFIGENVVTHRVITKEEALVLCDEENSYCTTWSDEKKLNIFMTPWVGD